MFGNRFGVLLVCQLVIKYPMLRLGVNNLPSVNSFVYFGVNFKVGLKLCVDYTLRCRKFLVAVCGVLRSKVAEYEDIFVNILVIKCLPILDYGPDCVVLDSYSFNVMRKAWNTAFRWLFNYGRFESTRWLFHAKKTHVNSLSNRCKNNVFRYWPYVL